ncbi:hypothetical protein, partial [Massilia aquatica]
MQAKLFERAREPAQLAALVCAALRGAGAREVLAGQGGAAMAERIGQLVDALRRHEVRPHELVGLGADAPAALVEGVLAAWLAGATPCLGAQLPPLRLRLDGAALASGRAAPRCLAAALVLVEPLVGAIAHPLDTLGRACLPDAVLGAAGLAIVADWRADVWLPLVLQALEAGVERLALLPAAPGVAVAHGMALAAPLAW